MVAARKAKPIVRPRKRRATPAPGKASSADLKQQLAEARAQQAATAEILKVIARSPSDVQPVFDAIARTTVRLLGSDFSTVQLARDGQMHLVAHVGPNRKAFARYFPRPRETTSIVDVAIRRRKVVQLVPIVGNPKAPARTQELAQKFNYNAIIAVPLVRDGEAIGAIATARREAAGFDDRQIAVLRTFADQAVIAIENVRLFNETREALERQTATAEILNAMSSSPSDVQPVFDAIVKSGVRLFENAAVAVARPEGGEVRLMAIAETDSGRTGNWAKAFPFPLRRDYVHAAAILDCAMVELEDASRDDGGFVAGRRNFAQTGYRAMTVAPMVRNGACIGTISVVRAAAGALPEKLKSLLRSFADQAVIAIENVRLFNETREALEQQKASADVLGAISGSITDTTPVFDRILDSCERLFAGNEVGVTLATADGKIDLAAYHGRDYDKLKGVYPLPLSRESGSGVAILDAAVAHYADVEAAGVPPGVTAGCRTIGMRSIIFAPMLYEGRGVGALWVGRSSAGEFTEKQVGLLRTFADQAVIAIQNARLFNETKEALERQTSTAEILRVIASSPADVQPVFDAIAQSATRLLDGFSTAVIRVEGDKAQLAAFTSTGKSGDAALRGVFPVAVSQAPGNVGRAMREKAAQWSEDVETDTTMPEDFRAAIRARGWRSGVAVPMVRQGEVIGAINVTRREPGRFSAHQIGLLTTFADQAVIAIENVRLFNETREALERQTATAEILKVIASSPSDVQPVFEAIADNAKRLLGGFSGMVLRFDGELLHLCTVHSELKDQARFMSGFFPVSPVGEPLSGRCVLERAIIQTPDLRLESDPRLREIASGTGVRAVLVVPMLRDGAPIGTISVARTNPGAFSLAETELLTTFADQAVIAIENVRLFNETKEALERQTATAEILKVIAGSPSDVQPVFDTIAERAATLCSAKFAYVTTLDGEWVNLRATHGPGAQEHRAHYPVRPGGASVGARVIRDGAPVQIEDVLDDAEYAHKASARSTGFRSGFGVPMMRDGKVLGAISLARPDPGPIPEKYIRLLQTFADQAVIAIENVRLFNETKEALERQTATAEILKVISASPTDVQPVFEAIVKSGMKLFSGAGAGIGIVSGDEVVIEAAAGMGGVGKGFRMPLSRDSASGTAILEHKLVNIADTEAPGVPPHALENGRRLGIRSMTQAPMFREGEPIGSIGVMLKETGGLDDKQLALLRTFADQAVIAIENVRLFNETREALERQTATSDILKVIAGSPSNVQPVLDAVAERAARLCDAVHANVLLCKRERLHIVADFASEEGPSPNRSVSVPLARTSINGRAFLDRTAVHVEDLPAVIEEYPDARENLERFGNRVNLAVPMLCEAGAIGTLYVWRREARQFSRDQITLLETFAAQAVIAIENVRLFNETKEALERQTATAEVLKVIASSPSDVQPVFDVIAERAVALSGAHDGVVTRFDGQLVHFVAMHKVHPEGAEAIRSAFPCALDRNSAGPQAIRTSQVVHLPDVREIPDYHLAKAVDAGGVFRMLAVPLLREGKAMGAITLAHKEPGYFSDHVVELLKTFADQAVIAIENVRLFNETKEALERQVATGEVLAAMSGSMTDAQPVFDKIVQSLRRLFGTRFTVLQILRGDMVEMPAVDGIGIEKLRERYPRPIDETTVGGRAMLTKQPVQFAPVLDNPATPEATVQFAKDFGFNSVIFTPMIHEGKVIGAIGAAQSDAKPFDERQIALIKTFADQAVIAIENVRLFKELQSRTEALTKSVGQLTALGEVGQAISSTLDLETVLQTIVSRAVQLTGMDAGSIYEYDEQAEVYRLKAAEKMAPELVEAVRQTPIRKGDGATGRTAVTLEPVQVADIQDKSYQGSRKDNLMRTGYRAVLAVPLLREDHLLGALQVFRRTPGAFAPEVVELLKTFATQSAMAIQNARLFREIAQKGRELEEASRHKSDFLASMSHELRTPLNAILGFNEMILGQVYGEVPADMKEPLEDIQKSGKHLLRLINNVLDLAKIEAGRMELSVQEYSVQDTVESVRATLRPLAAEKGLEFRASVPGDLPLARGDGGRIAQCLMNLAGNSLKFTRSGKVEIAVLLEGDRLRFSVADTGIGIPADKIGGLFTEFKQTDASIASEYGGTGLGLSITKKFVEMHGGRIWVESEPGRGSSFLFEVPLRVST